MRTSLLILLLTILAGSIFGQSGEPCGSGIIHDHLLDTDSVYHRSWMVLEQRLHQLQLEQANDTERDETIYTIPVVFHVIHEGEPVGQGSNISDAQIFSAIDALNEDFRKIAGSNGDGAGVDVGFEFCLAARDPNGNPTTGIVRIDGSVVANYADQGIRATGSVGADEVTVKALSTWPRADYLNIWVVNEIEDNNASSGIQGFAYFPINNPIDGVCILHNATGTIGNIKPSTALNRTLTHEVGHYFGLYHTFHMTTSCSGESNCTTQGDRVCDTPPTILASSCSSPACSGTQQVENYMDYTSEACRDMFSQGQKDRMRNTLLTQRNTLIDSFGCVPVTDIDAGITSILQPAASGCSTVVEGLVELTNFGSQTLTSVTIHFNIDNTGTQTYAWTGSLSSGNTTQVALPAMPTTMADHTFNAWVSNPNGSADQNNGNDETSKDFTIASGVGITMTVTLDYFGAETSWDIRQNGDIIAAGGPFNNSNQGAVFASDVCLPDGCYDLNVYDAYGDGMSLINGTYNLTDEYGNVLASGGGNFGLQATHNFCVEHVVTEVTPTANFSCSDVTLCAGQSTNFSDLSLGSPTGWSWTFTGASPATSSAQNPSNITYSNPGTYAVTLTAYNGAGSDAETKTAYITVTANPSVSVTASNVSCNGYTDGSVSATATGGSGFVYSWNTSASGSSLSNVGIGNYTVTVTNSGGCSGQGSAAVTQPAAISISLTTSNVSCNGAGNGSATAASTGGTGSMEYSWSNGATGSVVSGLTPGSYSVTATDQNGCTKTSTFNITQPTILVGNLTVNNISCNGDPGSAHLVASGGTPPYTIAWNSGATGNHLYDLTPGSYSVVLTDAKQCTWQQSFTIVESDELNVNLTVSEISCNSSLDGAISADVNGGVAPYSFSWNTGANGASLSNLSAGTYSVTVTDASGCQGTGSASLIEPSTLQLAIFKSDISCFGSNDGTATATASGGTAPYTYSWSHGATTANINNLGVGSYTLTVSDARGCSVEESIQIIEPSELTLSALISQPETCVGMDGEAIANAMGGTGNYTFVWSNGTTNQLLSSASSGQYLITVTDGNGCSVSTTVDIPYDCAQNVATTTLTKQSCGADNLALSDVIYCIPVEEAGMYQWRFTNIASGAFSDEYTLGSNPSFSLSNVPNLSYGMTVSVALRVMGNNKAWSVWGEPCLISTSQDVPLTSVTDSDCEIGIMTEGMVVQCHLVAGADVYEWSFTTSTEQHTFVTYMNQFNLSNAGGLLFGEMYDIRIRTRIGEIWSDWGDVCTMLYEDENAVIEGDWNNFSINVYPNPSNGENIFIAFRNLPSDAHVIDLEVYDGSGKLIENKTLSESVPQEPLTYHFQKKLSPGIYFLKIHLKGDVVEEKLIIE